MTSIQLTFLCILSFLSAFPRHHNPQGATYVCGSVQDARSGEFLSGAIVLIVRNGKDGSEYAMTNAQGHFRLELPAAPAAGDSIRVTLLGYATTVVKADTDKEMTVFLDPNPLGIKEVVVTARKVKMSGDTVSYNVQSFAKQQDKNIADVLKRMPGVEVHENGTITYNGETLGNLYVEGLDLVGGRYALITRNMSANDVKRIEIIENHQPVKALTNITMGLKPAMNIVLQDKVKGRWSGSSKLSGGMSSAPSILWDGNLFLSRISKKNSTINNLKTNNIGIDLGSEMQIKGLSGNANFGGEGGFVSVSGANAPLGTERVRFNTSVLANSSTTWSPAKDIKITVSAAYLFDRADSQNSSSTTYFLEDGEQMVQECEETAADQHKAQMIVDTETNKDKYFLRNKAVAEWSYGSVAQNMSGSFPNVQSAVIPQISIYDNLQYTGRIGNSAITIISKNVFSRRDESLTVLRTGNGTQQRQTVGTDDFNTDTYAAYRHKVSGRLSAGITCGMEASVRFLSTFLEGLDPDDEGSIIPYGYGNCNTKVAGIRPYMTPDLEYKSASWEIRLSAPVGWIGYGYGMNAGNWLYKISGSAKYLISQHFSLLLAGFACNNAADIHDFYQAYILRNYRNLSTGSLNTTPGRQYSATGILMFKDPVNMLFLNGYSGYWRGVSQTSFSRIFAGDYIISGTDYHPSVDEGWISYLDGSVGFYGFNGKLGSKAMYTDKRVSSWYQNGVNTPHRLQHISLNATFSGTFTDWLDISYKMELSRNILTLIGTSSTNRKDSANQHLTVNISPMQNLTVRLIADHFFIVLDDGQKKNTVLADAELAYRFSNGIEASLIARNLLDQRTYAYSVFNGLTSFSCEYLIRPLNIIAGIYMKF